MSAAPGDVHRDVGTPSSWGVLALLFVGAIALRPQIVGIGPLVGSIQADLALSHTVAGLLDTIPVLGMGLLAPVAPFLAARIGTAGALRASLALIGSAGIARAFAPDAWTLLGSTALIGIGMGVGGALLPVYVKQRMAARPVVGTAAYASGLQLGAAASAAVAAPLALAFDGWRAALAIFSAVTLVILVPWLGKAAREPGGASGMVIGRRDFGDRRGWLLAILFALYGVVYYGLIAWLAPAYVELGWSAQAAGGLVGSLNLGSLVGALAIGFVAGRVLPYATSMAVLAITFAVATLGVAILPALALPFAVVVGIANGGLFALIMALPLRIAEAPERVAGLSSVMIGLGYTIAALSPIGLGLIRDVSGGFRPSLLVLGVVAIAFALGASIVGRWRGATEPAPGSGAAA